MEQRLRDRSIASNLIGNAEHWIGVGRSSDIVLDRLLAFRSGLGNVSLERRVFRAAMRLSGDIGDSERAAHASKLLEERRWKSIAIESVTKALRH